MLSLEEEHIFERCKEANSGFRVEAYTFKMGNPVGFFNLCKVPDFMYQTCMFLSASYCC